MFDKTKLITSTATVLFAGILLAGAACAQSASLYGGGAANVGVGAGGGGGSGMDPAGSGPGPSGGTVFGGWPPYAPPGRNGLAVTAAPTTGMAAAPATDTKQRKTRKPVN
jgi:hypothetical protein